MKGETSIGFSRGFVGSTKTQSGFKLTVERNSTWFWFCITTLSDWLKNSRHFLDQSDVKPKPIRTRTHASSRARRTLHGLIPVLIGSLSCLHVGFAWLVKKNSRHFLDQSEVKPKPTRTCTHTFSRARSPCHVFDSSSDWFTEMVTSAVIGRSNYFDFRTRTVN